MLPVAYKNGDFTDLVISCGNSTFDVHSVVVGSACEFFAKNIKFGGKEADERRIDLPDDEPEMIRRLIAYLYLGDYDPTDDIGIATFEQLKQYDLNTAAAPAHHPRRYAFGSSQRHDQCACLALNLKNIEQSEMKIEQQKKASQYVSHRKPDNSIEITSPLTIHASMYALADKYQVKGLSRLAKTKFRESLDHHVDSEDFIAAVQLTYSNTPETNRGLRDEIVQAFRTYFKVDITELPGLESKLDTIDELAFLLLKSWPRKMESTSPQKFASSAGAAHTASHLVITAGPPTSGTNATSGSSNAPVTSTGFASYAHTPDADVALPHTSLLAYFRDSAAVQETTDTGILSSNNTDGTNAHQLLHPPTDDNEDEESGLGFWGEVDGAKSSSESYSFGESRSAWRGAAAFCCLWCAFSVMILGAFSLYFAVDLVLSHYGLGTGMAEWVMYRQQLPPTNIRGVSHSKDDSGVDE
ncbi:uncharacterized protein J4E87_001418 [Alternaria ethzedia]|uniref:uncharacterized protein n=1 Tax=Alternaria ethzedia TaxID=181014 RepID=UPI0020C229D9|nr:uncharacterized protein J4E87_001418 [Alternaria ethzedia]KAI4634246.1 hypothetical protein J4E87_001418 [Alternaria ethzedia]